MAVTDPGRIASELPARVRQPRTRRSATAGPPSAPIDPEKPVGVSGTENMFGIITGTEYLAALVPPQGLKKFEEMRNNAQVNASLLIVKAPILSSRPVIEPPPEGDRVDQAIADFCQASLFGQGAMSYPWRLVFEHLMTRLDFGVSVCEKVWRYDRESGTWRINKLAPRLATTLYEWRQHPETQELETVVQQALRQDGTWLPVPIPASKCVVSTYQREGDNYWGRSILRSAYFHWFALMELLRIDLVRADRWGVGIPKAKFTDETAWKDRKLVLQIKRALMALRSHERAYVLEHPQVEFSMLQLAGSEGGVKLTDSIDYHSTMIIQNVLATFLSGQADGMSTNRTAELADIFTTVLELVAADIAGDISEQVVRELCDLNFVMAGRPYPSARFTNIAHTDLDALVNQVTRLVSVGAITPGPDDETRLRELTGLPPRDPEADNDDEDPRDAKGGRGAADPDDIPDDDVEEDAEDDDHPSLRARHDDVLLGRAPTALETFLLRQPEQLARSLNGTAKQLEQRLAAVRRVQLEEITKRLAKLDARKTTSAFTDLRPDNLTIPARGLTAKAIRDLQKEAFADGRRRVRQELARQGATVDLRLTATSAEVMILAKKKRKKAKPQPEVADTSSSASSALVTSAKVTAERLNDAWFNRILEVAVRLRRGGLIGQALVDEIWKSLESEIGSALTGTARAEINEAFGLGRAVEAKVQADEIEKCVYSCLLDVNSCDPCAQLDGTETAFGSETYYELLPPYKGCEGNKGGGDACRCMWLFLMTERTV